MIKKALVTASLALLLVLGAGKAGEASVGPKALNVYYNDLRLNVDGTPITTSPAHEPFIIEGITFVPVRILAEALNFDVAWQADTRTIVITSKMSSEVANLIQLVQKKDQEIQNLKQQIEQLTQQLETTQQTSTNLGNLENNLKHEYERIGNVYIEDLDLGGDKDNITVKVWVDLDEYADEWADLSNSEIKNWIEDLVSDIQGELSKYTNVSGRIINSYNNDVLIKFSRKGTDTLSIDYRDEDYRQSNYNVSQATQELKDKTYYVDTITFNTTDIRYYESSERVNLYLTATTSNARDTWKNLSSSRIKIYVKNICEYVAEVFEDAGADLEEIKLYFYDNSSQLLDTFTYDVDEEELD